MTAEPLLPDEGLLQAYLDDELAQEDRVMVESHLKGNPAWSIALQELTEASDLLRDGLRAGDRPARSNGPPPWIGVLKRSARTAPPRFPLGRAAAVAVLVVGAVASGLPGSPVREWFADTFAQDPPPAVAAIEEAPAPEVPAESADEVGVRVGTPAGVLEVVMPELTPTTTLVVRLQGVTEAGVFGATGTQFRTRDGRVDILVAPGPLRIELPESLSEVTIQVGDEVYLRRAGAELTIEGPVVARSEAEVQFALERE